jgi:hypothetical protein
MKKRKFDGGGEVEDVSPEDIAERKRLQAATRAFDKKMPEADTTFGKLAGRKPKAKAKSESSMPDVDTMGNVTGYAKGGTASARADGIAQRGKTRGTMVMCGGGYTKGK